MIVSILSGKGGTGKTLVSVNLAAVSKNSTYIDCDVEEPNGHLFFKPDIKEKKEVSVKIPIINNELCDGCRKCIDFCKFNALALIKEEVLVFEDICHSCGGCSLVCPNEAITEKDKVVGIINEGMSNDTKVISGIMNIREVSATPIIRELLSKVKDIKEDVFIDCPPGSACLVMESIKDSDYCVLVAEPTTFGVHNLSMVYELVKLFNKPFGVVINKYSEKHNIAEDFCLTKGIEILAKIPYENELATLNSKGEIVSIVNNRYKNMFDSLLKVIKNRKEGTRL